MKKTLLIISLLTIILISGFAKNNQTDSIAYANQTVQLNELNSKVDSLLKVTDKLTIEKSYFSSTLSSQTTIFGVIITIALALFGLISFITYKKELENYKTETKSIIDGQDDKINKIEEVNKKHDYDINDALAKVFVVACDLYKHDSVRFIFSLNAAKYYLLNKSYTVCESNLAKSTEVINKTILPKDFKKNVSDYSEDIEADLELLSNSENKRIKNMAIMIYSKYIEIKEQEPVVETSPEA